MTTKEKHLKTYTALLALPDGEMARDAASRMTDVCPVEVTDDPEAGVWLRWTTEAPTDEQGVYALQELRLRAEMRPECAAPNATTASGASPTLFQATPFIVLRGDTVVIHSEEVYCV